MEIRWLGHSCFRLQCGETSIVTDPFSPRSVGYDMPVVSCDAVTCSHAHNDHAYMPKVRAKKAVTPEKDTRIGDVQIRSLLVPHDPFGGRLRGFSRIFFFTYDGLTVCHMGDIGVDLDEKLCEQIGHVDILLLPVGGTYTIDARQAYDYVRRLRPALVLPMHFKTADVTLDIAPLDAFLHFCDPAELRDEGEVLTVTRDSLPQETKIVLLRRTDVL